MTKRILVSLVTALGLVLGATAVQARESTSVPTPDNLLKSGANVHDRASLQRGAKLFMNYCSGCHSLHFMRYSRIATDLGLTQKQVMQNLNFTGARFHDNIVAAMPHDDAVKWFGKAPPDLSVIVDQMGPDWVYTYLNSFYLDPSAAVGWNNTVLKNAAMPNPLWELQGIQVAKLSKATPGTPAVVEGLSLARPGRMTPVQFQGATRDITAFLAYVSDPSALPRYHMAPWVLLYLAAFTFLAWLLKHEYWKDVH